MVKKNSSRSASGSQPFSVHSMLAMKRIGDPHVSPNGETIAFTVNSVDATKSTNVSSIWLVNADGKGLRRLTSSEQGDSSPQWSPDGRHIYFLSSRSDLSQVWRIAVDGGEAERVTDLPLAVGSLRVSPTGKHIAFSMDVFPDAKSPMETRERLDELANRISSGQVFERLFIRHWDTWKDGRRSHLFVMPIGGGAVIDVTRGMDADIPSMPFGGSEEYTFTPDGKEIVFAARVAGRKESWTTAFNLYRTPVLKQAKPKRITDSLASLTSPVFSPDGKTLAYLAMARAGYEADRYRIVLRSWPRGQERVLTEDWDRSADSIVWSADGKTVYTTAANVGQHSLFAVNVRTGGVKTVLEKGSIGSAMLLGRRLGFVKHDLKTPAEIFSAEVSGSNVRPITRINAATLATVRMGDFEQIHFKGWNDEKVYAYVLKPADFKAGRKYPVAFLIHGGPQGSFGNMFHYRWNAQAYAGAGYAVVMVDFHGSTGYGQAFTDSINGDWGGKPFIDLQKGLQAALDKYAWMDAKRVAALGASYGGYMINWIAGQWPDRFRCLVNHDGNIDEQMAYYNTEELWFPEWERGGPPWKVPHEYTKHNPIDHIGKWKAPMLVIHGGRDYRVVDEQGLATFTALQRRNIPSKLLYFPDENHWVLKPANSVQWHETVIAWLDQWTKGKKSKTGR